MCHAQMSAECPRNVILLSNHINDTFTMNRPNKVGKI